MRSDDIQLALRVTRSRNPYIVACWLSELRGYWSAGDMAEVKQALGMDPNQIDNEVAVGIRNLIQPGPPERAYHKQKRKIDEELQAVDEG